MKGEGDTRMAVAEFREILSLTADEVRLMNAYRRAANYLSVAQIYLYGNPLLREPQGEMR
jgi:xylulose-5-phosphate/fructose-6-phosphate phosphoketolase